MEFDDIYESIKIKEANGIGWYYSNKYYSLIKASRNPGRIFLEEVENIASKLVKYDSNSKTTILLMERRFSGVVRILRKNYNVISLSSSIRKDYDILLRGAKVYYPWREQWNIDNGFLKHDVSWADKAMNSFAHFINRNNIKAVILGNDLSFMERTIIMAARKCNVPTIVIQHALFQKTSVKQSKICKYTDYVWVWSEHFKDTIKDDLIDGERRVHIIGYPFELRKVKNPLNKRVLYFGAPYRDNMPEKVDGYNKLIETVSKICDNLGLQFVYRPHPSENRNAVKKDFAGLSNFQISNENNLLRDVANSAAILGDDTVAFLESALMGRNCIQVSWDDRSYETYHKPYMNYVYKINFDYDEIKNAIYLAIKDLLPEPTIDDKFIWINKNLEQTVCDDLNKIIQ